MYKHSRSFLVIGIVWVLTCIACSNKTATEDGTTLWPEIEPYESGFLKVSDIHEIYYELSGNPDGIPVFVIHWGPGAGCSPFMRRFFDPEKYLIVLHDQRGCGKSKPNAELSQNKTQALVGDIEKLRQKLNVEENLHEMVTMNLVGSHFFANNCFLEEGQILRDIGNIPDIPVIIVHGRYDMVCPPSFAYKLHQSIPRSKLKIVEKAGHSLTEKPIETELVKTMKELETLLD